MSNLKHLRSVVGRIKAPKNCRHWSKGSPLLGDSLPKSGNFQLLGPCDKVTKEEVLRRVNDDRQMLNSIWQRTHRWIGHVLRQDSTFRNVVLKRILIKDGPLQV